MSALVTVGDTALQFSPRGDERLETARDVVMHAEGIESGAAVAGAALGGESTWVTKLPDSPLGRQVVGQLRQRGVDTEVTWTDVDGIRQGLVFRDPGQSPRQQTVEYDCRDTPLASANGDDLPIDLIRDAGTALVGLSTAVLSDPAEATTEAVFRAARDSGVTTAAALDYRAGLRSADRYREAFAGLVEYLDVLVATEAGAETVFRTSGLPRELAHALAAEFDLDTVVVTRSDGGAVALRDTPGTDVVHERDGIETEAVDATGRQAAFLGAFLQRLTDDADIPESLAYGVASGALASTVPGPLLTATREEIESTVEKLSS